MFGKHVTRHLSAYHHQELTAGEKLRVERHLQTCPKCRTAYEEIQLGARLASVLQVSSAPDLMLNGFRRMQPVSARRRWIPAVVAASFAAAMLMLAVLTRSHIPAGPSWEVTGLPGTSQLRPGDVLQTDTRSKAEVKIANIGQLLISPNTRIRLLVTKSDQHRIALDRGKVDAQTWAPPRLFIVDTPSASAIDLGCKYSLEVQDDGSSLLHVTLGLVALERNGYDTIVPAGAFCRTRRGTGPGTPFFEDSSTELQSALQRVDSLDEGPERTQQLEIVIREAHVRDGLSLWHLLPHVDAQSRGLIYDRLAQLLPPPPDVTRDGIVALDPKMLDSWKKVVSQLWQ
jgi:ferric-dicitrate binding protein FerR (iron transport regulator)